MGHGCDIWGGQVPPVVTENLVILRIHGFVANRGGHINLEGGGPPPEIAKGGGDPMLAGGLGASGQEKLAVFR